MFAIIHSPHILRIYQQIRTAPRMMPRLLACGLAGVMTFGTGALQQPAWAACGLKAPNGLSLQRVSLSPQQLQSVSKGNVVIQDYTSQLPKGSKSAWVQASVLVPKSPDDVWQVVSQPKQLMKYENKVKKISVVTKTGSQQTVDYAVDFGALLPTFNYTLALDGCSPQQVMQFKRVSGSFNDFKGVWHLKPADKGTVLTYSLFIDPGMMMPGFLVTQLLKADLPSMMQHVKLAILQAK
jgi:ribosome-associated toxin RatA of RatAB toxin-antitoxin module